MGNPEGSAAPSAPAARPGGSLQLTLSFGSLTAPLVAIAGARASGNPLSPGEVAACVAVGFLGMLTVQIARNRRERRHGAPGRVLGRIGLGRRSGRSECGYVDTQIRDPKDVQREALTIIHSSGRPREERDRAVHALAHGRASDDASRRTLRNAIQDRKLDQDQRFGMAETFCRCNPDEALAALDLFSRESANDSLMRLRAAKLINEPVTRSRAILAIAFAADVAAECRLDAAIALQDRAPYDAEAALQALATDVTDGAKVGFRVRIQAAQQWASLNRERAVEVLWQIARSPETPWYWRIEAAFELAMLKVRAAYKLLLEWGENRELPEEVRGYLFSALSKLDAQRPV
jgi:hypothetical protein